MGHKDWQSDISRTALAALFAAAGAASLAYQVVWQRVLAQEVGSDTISGAIIVTIFLSGIAFGSLVGGQATQRTRKAHVLFLCAQLVIGSFAFVSVDVLRYVNGLSFAWSGRWFDLVINFSVLILPTFFMGFTAPLVIDLVKEKIDSFGDTVGLFYGLNVLGASLGVLGTGFFMIEMFGVEYSVRLAGCVDILVGIIIWRLLSHGEGEAQEASQSVESHGLMSESSDVDVEKGGLPVSGLRLFVACFFFGLSTISLEMVLFRVLANHFTLYSVIFPVILFGFLVAMALGEWVGGRVADRVAKHPYVGVSSLVLTGVFLLVIAFRMPNDWVELYNYSTLEVVPKVTLALSAFFAPVVVLTALFPIMVRSLTPDIRKAGSSFGNVLFVYGVGNAVAAALVPLVLFNTAGTMLCTVLIVALTIAGAAILLPWTAMGDERKSLISSVLMLIVGAALVGLIPMDYFSQSAGLGLPGFKAVDVLEDDVSVVSVFDTPRGVQIRSYRSPTATVLKGSKFEGKHKIGAVYDIDTALEPKRILVIGLGGANWLPELVARDFVEEIVIVELSESVFRAVHHYGGEEYQRAFSNPKVKVVFDDGRRFVRRVMLDAEQRPFDMVQLGVYQPWMAGAGNLYTREFLHDLKSILAPGGVVCTLDLSMIARTMLEEFETMLWFPDSDSVYLYFYKEDLVSVARRFDASKPSVSVALADEYTIDDFDVNSDDRPIAEYFFVRYIWSGGFELGVNIRSQTDTFAKRLWSISGVSK